MNLKVPYLETSRFDIYSGVSFLALETEARTGFMSHEPNAFWHSHPVSTVTFTCGARKPTGRVKGTKQDMDPTCPFQTSTKRDLATIELGYARYQWTRQPRLSSFFNWHQNHFFDAKRVLPNMGPNSERVTQIT